MTPACTIRITPRSDCILVKLPDASTTAYDVADSGVQAYLMVDDEQNRVVARQALVVCTLIHVCLHLVAVGWLSNMNRV